MFIVSQAVKISGYNFVWAHGNRVLTFYGYIVSFSLILFHPQGSLSHLQSSKTIILYGSFSYFFFSLHIADRGAFRFIQVQWWSYTFPCFHAITIFSRDLTSDWLRSPVAATFSFGRTVVCFHATICAHTLDTALRSICLSFFLSFWPHFLTYSVFNSDVNQILEGIMYYVVFSILYADAFVHRVQVRLHLSMRDH